MSRSPRTPGSIGMRTLVLSGVIFCIAIVVMFAFVQPQRAKTASLAANPPAAPAPAPHFIDLTHQGDTALRTLVIAGPQDVLPGTSNAAGYLMANLRIGQLPDGATTAIVRSDTNCEPDQDGVSHCLNELQIGATLVTVQHHHNMQQVPCLSPGEKVNLLSLAAYQG